MCEWKEYTHGWWFVNRCVTAESGFIKLNFIAADQYAQVHLADLPLWIDNLIAANLPVSNI